MDKQLSYSRKAVADLDAIWEYTERRWVSDQAQLYTRTIRSACLELFEGPITAGRYALGDTMLIKLRVAQHLVFLGENEDGLLVVRILHVRQDIDQELG